MPKTYTIYANCQTSLIDCHLNLSEEFKQKYSYEEIPRNFVAIQQKLDISEEVLQKTKLFIYQPVDSKHGNQSSEYILQKLPSDCITISFPYIYFKGYWLESTKNPVNKRSKEFPFGKFPYGDANIIDMTTKGYSKNQIIEELHNPDFYDESTLVENVDSTLEELRKREKETDVKIADFIEANYKDIHLFYSPNHPANIIGFHIANQILQLIGMSSLLHPNKSEKFSGYQVPIYPSVINKLGLSFVQQNHKYNLKFAEERLNFGKYIEEYLLQYPQYCS